MARTKYKKRVSWKQIISGILVGVLLLGAVGLGISIFGNERKEISPLGYSIGDLHGNDGTYKEDTQHIYMKEMFACKGLKVEPKFDNKHTYQLFFYDYDGEFLCTYPTDSSKTSDAKFTEKDLPIGAYYCRMVIEPDIPIDVSAEDFEIKFWEVVGYADDFSVSVTKDQTPVNYFDVDARNMKATVQESVCVFVEEEGNGYTEEIDVTDIAKLRLLFDGDRYSTSCVFIDSTGKATSYSITAGSGDVEVDIPAGVESVIFNYDVGHEYKVIAISGR